MPLIVSFIIILSILQESVNKYKLSIDMEKESLLPDKRISTQFSVCYR